MASYKNPLSVVEDLQPEAPVHVFRPHAVANAVSFFQREFPGNVMYAVKTNPEPRVIALVSQLGVNAFDVASLEEVRLVHSIEPKATLFFMHTVKSRHAIREAYYVYGVRRFSLDSHEELEKILEETNHAKDLQLFVRLAIPNSYAEYSLSDKFGISVKDSVLLLRAARKASAKLGICFHVGSQCMHPDAYRIAMRMAKDAMRLARVTVDVLDVGGGFPSVYPGMQPPAMGEYFRAIREEFAKFGKGRPAELFCEPGRALVAESGSVVVRVELRKGNHLYLNDGTYGSLFDAGTPHFIFPAKLLRSSHDETVRETGFSFFGPTCDTLDFMKGPFFLPDDIREGDYIEIGQLGAYSRALGTRFNGFAPHADIITVQDAPLMTMYGEAEQQKSQPQPSRQLVAA